MINSVEVDSLVQRLKDDYEDYEGLQDYSHGLLNYLKELLEDGNLAHEAAIGSAKLAITQGIGALTELQLKAIALDMLKNDVYLPKCPNDWCSNLVSWSDMSTAIYDGNCCECQTREERIMNE
ncbi:hypothetical protein [Solibacillus sp. FSL W8-0372]|uniref:hypothetical protein n=1 Tax=Solibacillus sp. FSL W8-0372 TaxID=2921713 RepID=UPI0030D177A1